MPAYLEIADYLLKANGSPAGAADARENDELRGILAVDGRRALVSGAPAP